MLYRAGDCTVVVAFRMERIYRINCYSTREISPTQTAMDYQYCASQYFQLPPQYPLPMFRLKNAGLYSQSS